MTTSPHKTAPLNQTHPLPGLGPYANTAARLGATVTSVDVGKCAIETSSGALYLLVSVSPMRWQRISAGVPVKPLGASSYTAAVGEIGCLVPVAAGAISTVTLPSYSASPIEIGDSIEFKQDDANQIQFVAGSGATVGSVGGLLGTSGQNARVRAFKQTTNGWWLSGDLAAVSGGAFAGDFAALFTAAGLTVTAYHRSDLGLHKTGSIVNSWDGQVGPTITEGSSGVGLGTASTGLGGHAGIVSDGSTQWGTFTQSMAAPGTTPIHFWWVVKQLTPVGYLEEGGGSNQITFPVGAGVVYILNGTYIGPATMTASTWGCLEGSFSNDSTGDYVKFGASAAVVASGTSAGNTASSARGLFAQPGGGTKGAFEVLARLTCTGTRANYQTAAATAKTAAKSFYATSVT